MTYQSFVQSHFLKTISTLGSIVFVSLLLINPDMYTGLMKETVSVNANFLSNEYQQDLYIVNDDGNIISSDEEEPIQEPTPLLSYIVQPGDSIEQIAQKYAVSVDQIKAVNNMVDNDLLAGQKLYITNRKGFVYEVKEESISLMVFANLYGINENQLLEANGQSNNMIPYEKGQAIFVPGLSLEDAYTLSLLVKPEPKPQPQKIIVNTTTKKPSSSVSSTVKKKPAPSLINVNMNGRASLVVSSWRYVFKEKNTMAAGQCTYYAAHKAKFAFPEISPGVRFRAFGGNANKWLGNARAVGFKTASTPSAGAIAVFQQGGSRYYSYGHVAIVEEVDRNNKRIKVSDMNYSGLWTVTVRWIAMNDAMTQTKGGQTLLGFIPVQELPSDVKEKYQAAKG